ncbi:hypothetical protein HCA68_15490 [Listeria booriae]|nr:hypothetical protein [Listeria booriae]
MVNDISSVLKRKKRNKDIRQLCNILHDKYYIDKSKVARAMKLPVQYYYDFVADTRDLLYPNLIKIESFIFDLYDPILEYEMERNNIHLDPLDDDSDNQISLNI